MSATTPLSSPTSTTVRFPFADDNDSPITIPAPTSVRVARCHQRAHTAVDPPLLFNRPGSVSPSRSSTFLPFLRPTRDRSISPERVSVAEAAEFAVNTPDGSVRLRLGKVEKLASWFDAGTSEPVKIGLCPSPSREKPDPLSTRDTTSTPDTMEKLFSASTESVDNLTKRPNSLTRTPLHQSSPSTGRFNFFRKSSHAQMKPDVLANDDIANLDIQSSLFPAGLIDEFSPASFKNLQMNAEGTVKRLQAAYCEKARALKSASSEKSVQGDELEAAQTRNEHLKLQLVEMAERAAAQEKITADLQAELNNARTIRMVPPSGGFNMTPQRSKQHRSRTSDVSESGSELSTSQSIFSESRSNCESLASPGTSVSASPVLKSAIMFRPSPQDTAFGSISPIRRYEPGQVLGCQNCHGLRANEAWDVVTVMKAESVALKSRIEELEGAQGDVLTLLHGIGSAV